MKWQILFLAALIVMPLVTAQFQDPTAAEEAAFDEILAPIMTIYNLVKYAATIVASVMMLFSGITYMTSGGDPKKKETAKNMATYVIIGLLIIWVAPLVVNLLVA